MENYIKAQQEIVNRAAQISARHVIVFADGLWRVIRGGGWYCDGSLFSRVSYHHGSSPSDGDNIFGL